MDWPRIVQALRATELKKVLEHLGVEPGSESKDALVRRVMSGVRDPRVQRLLLDQHLVSDLETFAARAKLPIARRKDDLVESLLQHAASVAADEGALDVDRPDAKGIELPLPEFELVPAQPHVADRSLFHELLDRLRDEHLHRVTLVSYNCNAEVLERLTSHGLDELLEFLVARRRTLTDDDPSVDEEALFTLVLDAEHHGLDGTTARRFATMARELPPGVFRIRLGPVDRRLHAKIYAFETTRGDEPHLVGYVGSSNLSFPGLGASSTTANIEANVRIAGPIDRPGAPQSLWAWVRQLVQSPALSDLDPHQLPVDETVQHQLHYKLHLDTAHELRLKHFAERLSRRGRFAWPRCDLDQLPTLPAHQLVPVARSARSRARGFLLLDEVGLGKTIEAGLILSRELRRRRARPGLPPLRALILAPVAIHEQWREELRNKFSLQAAVFSRGPTPEALDAETSILITSPTLAYNRSAELPSFDVVLVDEFHRARGELTHEELKTKIAKNADVVLLASGTPVQNRLQELRSTFELVEPTLDLGGDDAFADLFGDGSDPVDLDALREILRPIATRAFRRHLLGIGDDRIPPRVVRNEVYDLSPTAARTYTQLCELADRYQQPRGRPGFAFMMLEQLFLSSPHAFLPLARHLTEPRVAFVELERDAVRTRDDSYAFIRRDRDFQSALRLLVRPLREEERQRSAKEERLLEILRGVLGKSVLIFTRFLATQERLHHVLSEAGLGEERARRLHGGTPFRDRTELLAWFSSPHAVAGDSLPARVLVCTDVAAEGLNLQAGCSVLVNYDLPWNPQRIEQRIGRLQRWGQRDEVLVFNLQARNPEALDGRTKDSHVVDVCMRKFGLAEMSVGASEALMGLDADKAELAIADDEEPTPDKHGGSGRSVESLDALFPGTDDGEHRDALDAARTELEAHRRWMKRFWQEANRGRATETLGPPFFQRVHHALLQGQFALLRRRDVPLAEARTLSTLVGLRVIVESCELELPGLRPEHLPLDRLRVEDELVFLWRVFADGTIHDATEWLVDTDLTEVLAEDVAARLGSDALDFLMGCKSRFEAERRDGAPWNELEPDVPELLRPSLEAASREAHTRCDRRLDELKREHADAHDRRRERFARLLQHAEARRAPKRVRNQLERLAQSEPPELALVPEIRLTQLALVFE